MFKSVRPKAVFFYFCLTLAGCNGQGEIAEHSSAAGQITDPQELTKLAHNRQSIGAYEEAIELLEKALRIKPEFFPAHLRMGLVFEEWDKKKEARKSYEHALKINPQNVDARLGLGSVYAKLKRNERAIEEYKKVAAMKPADPEIHFKIALEHWYIQQIPEAADQYRKAIEIDPGYLQARLNLASVYERMKEWENALEQIEIVQKLARETGDPQAISIAESKVPFLKGRMDMTANDLNKKSLPPFN